MVQFILTKEAYHFKNYSNTNEKNTISNSIASFYSGSTKNIHLNRQAAQYKGAGKSLLNIFKDGAWKETDSVEIKNGKFVFTGTVDEPKSVIVAVRPTTPAKVRSKRDYISFIIENSKITLEGKDSIYNAKVVGSVAEKENSEREALTKPLTEKIIALQNKYGKKNKEGVYEKPLEERKKAGDSISSLVAQIKTTNRKFAETHLNSYAGLYAFSTYVLDSKFVVADVEPLFFRFSPELQTSPLGQVALKKIEVGKRRQEGAKATDFTQNDQNGKPFTLSSLRGKYVLVDFWASWCLPCRAENPNVVKAYNALKGDKFEIVSVSLDAGKEAWIAAIEKMACLGYT